MDLLIVPKFPTNYSVKLQNRHLPCPPLPSVEGEVWARKEPCCSCSCSPSSLMPFPATLGQAGPWMAMMGWYILSETESVKILAKTKTSQLRSLFLFYVQESVI